MPDPTPPIISQTLIFPPLHKILKETLTNLSESHQLLLQFGTRSFTGTNNLFQMFDPVAELLIDPGETQLNQS